MCTHVGVRHGIMRLGVLSEKKYGLFSHSYCLVLASSANANVAHLQYILQNPTPNINGTQINDHCNLNT